MLPVLTGKLCRTGEPCLCAANPRITYHAVAFDVDNGGVDEVKGIGEVQRLGPRSPWVPSTTVVPGASGAR